ncbi:YdgA family protein [Nitrogeniibacter mangrovi]|uniref:YdgA family protein n=1 Tax=Nitrogeniibacter mangrovi TaxID=2016596 RepID=A0A6C1AYH8_9RHOO|nr:YdgA family protein [Nitrogeniibacter mangrovi]QID16421.1 YdgA family protein [Nitrogeniibacter mangrovi]
MKKSWIAVIALPVIAYPAASWYLGKQVQSTLDTQYAQLESLPYLKVVERQYERGVFSAHETVTLEVLGDMMRAMHKTAADAGDAPTNPAQPLRLSFRSEIRHGPWADGLAAAVIDSELVLPEAARAEAAKVFGDQPPLHAHTVIRLDGGGVSDVSSPAFAAPLPVAEDGHTGQIAWEGFTASVDFDAGMTRYTMQGGAPKLEVEDGKGVHLVMTGLHMRGEQRRLLEDEPLLYAGTQRFTLERMAVSGPELEGEPVELKQLEYTVDMPAQGDYLDLQAKMSAQVFQVGARNFGPAHYDFSMNHLHVRTVAKLYRALMDMYGDPALLTGQGNPQVAMAALAEPAMALLAHDPELRLDRLSFNTPQGEAHIQARAQLPGIAPEEVGNPMILLGKLDASGALTLPEAMMREMMVERTRKQIAAMDPQAELSDDQVAMIDARLEAQLQQAASEGYVTRDKGLIKSEFAFRNGQLTVNGKPFKPRGR